ncbi:chromosome segregation protein SMC [Candidatus Pacearchaeota archaeon]|nr:chromosome segregation protein SMC [Candidatus Pacearchaeota archaeon]
MFTKRLVMHGSKSFPRKTEIPFTPEINVILGPNGSGKSNISDALCFVLGRLSIKSIRASKSSNLIFLGSKEASPAKEASVELVFDNSDRVFSLDKDEISIKRIVKKNGQGIYKINDDTKTRQEVLMLLAQAGIDSNGFNLILQGEIQNFTRMHPEERRKIIEEVSGISVYEIRKEKSLKELEKTDGKLKEVHAILRERTSYLNNLERERQQALKFKKLEEDIKKFKASIISFDLGKKKKESEILQGEIEKRNREIEKIKKTIIEIQGNIANFESKITGINSLMKKTSGIEQEKLNQEIANLRAELAGMEVTVKNHESKLEEISRQKTEFEKIIREDEISVKELDKETPLSKKQKDIEEKKKELEELEKKRRNFYTIKSELKSVKERLEDKKSLLQNYSNESEFLLKQTIHISNELFDKKTDGKKVGFLKNLFKEKKEFLENLEKKETELKRISYVNSHEVQSHGKIIEKISKLDICPVCKSKITKEHVHAIDKETREKVNELEKSVSNAEKELKNIGKEKNILKSEIENATSEIAKRESDLVKLENIEGKKEQIKNLNEKIEGVKKEISALDSARKKLESGFDGNSGIEQKYETSRIELQEISLRSRENLNVEVSFKQRELERTKIAVKQLLRDEEDLKEELSENKKYFNEKEALLEKKREQEEELIEKFKKLISDRDLLHKKTREEETSVVGKQASIREIENQVNNLNIEKARISAEVENLEVDMLEFPNVEIIKTNRESLVNRLQSTMESKDKIGSVNLLSLEVYDSVKKEYDSVKEKAEIVANEKESIMKTINEIDNKKKKTFMRTLNDLNGIFTRNFSELSIKGTVSLELEDKKEPFNGGVGILVKTGHGKYFDANSLSGGEQTLVALSLIFAIQEYKPYYFYILDEVDAALDKRNSERLAELLKKHMQKGQYIIITHNDEVILNATNLYGVSMHEGISKVVSLRV